MKKALVLLAIVSGLLSGQSLPAFSFSADIYPATQRVCSDTANVGSIYTQVATVSISYICQQTANRAFSWVQIPAGGSGGGTVNVASGKTATINNSLTLAGTDGTTMTFPATSGTVVTLAATQTLTAKTLTAPVIATISNTGTETLPSNTGGIPIVIACGATSGATANCANTAVGATSQVYYGAATLASNASVITISPGFTSSSTYQCVANDQTTRANPVQAVPTSATTFTITNTTGATDVIQWVCVGN